MLPRPKSWPRSATSTPRVLFQNKSCDHFPRQTSSSKHESKGGLYDKVYELTMNELWTIQEQYNWLPCSVDFYTPSQLKQMTWAGRLLVEGWDEDDASSNQR